ncbi:hypothetical protein [Rufibacter roseus]|uniref:Outer membrane protein beta-barrel domain-containing protein n=1 Tax=Rufibacter roseus TaxID=1567108 RepID=A0ABW2DNJ8_9BACT|nr:hypothetical protein [Rufibacter roseus]
MNRILLAVALSLLFVQVQGQQLAHETNQTNSTDYYRSQTLHSGFKPVTAKRDSTQTIEWEEPGKAIPYLLLKASVNASAFSSNDHKVPLARIEAEVPVFKEVVHVGLIAMPTAIQHSQEDSELKVFGGLSAGIHFPFNKVIDPEERFSFSGIKPFMRGYATVNTGNSEESENPDAGSNWIFYAAYDLGLDWTLVKIGESRLGISAFSTNMKFWNFGLVLKLQ